MKIGHLNDEWGAFSITSAGLTLFHKNRHIGGSSVAVAIPDISKKAVFTRVWHTELNPIGGLCTGLVPDHIGGGLEVTAVTLLVFLHLFHNLPAETALKVYPVKIDNDEIFVEVE